MRMYCGKHGYQEVAHNDQGCPVCTPPGPGEPGLTLAAIAAQARQTAAWVQSPAGRTAIQADPDQARARQESPCTDSAT